MPFSSPGYRKEESRHLRFQLFCVSKVPGCWGLWLQQGEGWLLTPHPPAGVPGAPVPQAQVNPEEMHRPVNISKRLTHTNLGSEKLGFLSSLGNF